MNYLDEVNAQLMKMSEHEKDTWILSQAKLISENMRTDFLLSLSGEKKIINMPTIDDIEELCERIENGELYLEYETHYYEFDDDGRYMDDWKIWYNDPYAIIPRIDRIIAGCHRLVYLDEYHIVYKLLSRILGLKFNIKESEDSDDSPEQDYISLEDVESEGMLSESLSDAGEDWIVSYLYLSEGQENKERSHKLIEMFEHPVCKELKPRFLKEYGISLELFTLMTSMLEEDISDLECMMKNKEKESFNFHEYHSFRKKIDRKNELLLDIRLKCLETRTIDFKKKGLDLAESWKQINEISAWLNNEYIDDQPEMDDIQDICEELIKSMSIQQEKWEARKKVLEDIVHNDYYDIFGCSDIMLELADKLCTSKEEYLTYADIMSSVERYQEKAAYMYYQYGQEGKYVSYLENHLYQRSKEYNALLAYYIDHDQQDNARRIAELGLKNCKEDLSEMFIYLLLDAKKQENQSEFKKLYASAKRRKHVDIDKVNNALYSA